MTIKVVYRGAFPLLINYTVSLASSNVKQKNLLLVPVSLHITCKGDDYFYSYIFTRRIIKLLYSSCL